MIDIGKKLFKIRGAESHVAFAENNQLTVFFQGLFEAAVHTPSIPWILFDDDAGPSPRSSIECFIPAVVVHNDNLPYKGMSSKVGDGLAYTRFVIVCRQRDYHPPVGNRIENLTSSAPSLGWKQESEVQSREPDA